MDALITSFAFAAVTVAASNIVRSLQCFKEGTLVETEEGLKPIEEIEAGDKVLAYDEATGEQSYKEVVRLFRNETESWCTVYVKVSEKTEKITSTPGHKYYLPENNVCRKIGEQHEHASYEELYVKWVSACNLKKAIRSCFPTGSMVQFQ